MPPATVAAKPAKPTTPLVFVIGQDPVKVGLLARLDRPGGNATGVSDFVNQLVGKRLEPYSASRSARRISGPAR
jgi:putative ABC transport system substrate-binding protein